MPEHVIATTIAFMRISGGVRRAGGLLAAGAAGVGLASAAYQAYGTARDRTSYPPPGRLVDIGGRRLHLIATEGTGPPVVIIPALGGPALEWVPIQRALGPEIPVVLYDRGGLGWSDPAPGPRSGGVMADELHALLTAAGILPPYVLAGHSIGGLVALVYTARHPRHVAALALIDSSHPDSQQSFLRTRILSQQAAWLLRAAKLRLRPLGLRRLADDLGFLNVSESARSIYPEDLAAAGRALMHSSTHWHADVAEMLARDRTYEEARSAMQSLPQLPLTVLSSSEHDPHRAPGSRDDLLRRRWYITWRALQASFTDLVPGATHITAPAAGHYVHRDDPDLVVRVLRDLALQARDLQGL